MSLPIQGVALAESLVLQEELQPGFRVDRESKTIFDVCLLGPESKNGWKYSSQVIAEAAPRYNRKPVYLNHIATHGKRDVKDIAGRIGSPRLKDGRLYGDIKCIGKNGEMLLELAESDVDGIGMSHLTDDTSRVIDKTKTVVKIGNIKSVDLVDTPATTRTLKEDTALELKEQLSPLLEGKKPALDRLKSIYEAMGVEFKLEEQEIEKQPALTLDNIEDVRKLAGDHPVLKQLVEQFDSLRKDKWITEAITETKLTDTASVRTALAECATKEAMLKQGKVLREAIDSAKPAPVQQGRRVSEDKSLTVDGLVAAIRG